MATQITTNTYNGLFTKGTETAVQNTNVEEGKLRVATDSKRLFFDLDSSRIEITDIVWNYTDAQLTAGIVGETPILNNHNKRKLFIASDTGKAFVCDNTHNTLVPFTSFKVTSAGTADTATSATYASSADLATSSTYATSADSATSATYATSADSATSATNASSSTYATSADLATSASYASSATADADGNTFSTNYAKLNSPTFTGTPQSVTPSTADVSTKIATTEFVHTAVVEAIGGISGISIQIVQELPATGQSNVFYLIRNASTSGSNLYDEYIWIASSSSFENLGPISIDLTGYIDTISQTGSGNAFTGYSTSGTTVTFEKNSTFLTEHPSITVTANTTSSSTLEYGSTFTAIDSVSKDSNGHVTTYNTKTITLPSAASYATSANYATSADSATSATYATSADSSTSATSATYASSADTATSATNATSATYATSATSASTATNASFIVNGSTQNRIPYYGCGATTATAASTATADSFNLDFGDIDSGDYYY